MEPPEQPGVSGALDTPPEVEAAFGLRRDDGGQDRLRLLIGRPLTSLDPLRSWVTLESWLLHQVYDGLTVQEVGGPLRPSLAHHWAVAPGGLAWHFYLRRGVPFHHGRPLEAADVVYTLRQVQERAAWCLPGVQSVQALDRWTVRLTLSQPDPLLPRRFSQTPLLIQPHDAPADPDAGWLCGTGAFRFAVFTGGLRLSAFAGHYAGRPLLDEAEFFFMPLGTAGGRVELRGADAAGVQPARWAVERGVQFLIWNSHRPAGHCVPLRRALAELHDVRALFDLTGQPPAPLATSFYPDQSVRHSPRPRSLERARRWLADVPRPWPVLALYALPYPEAQAEAHWLAARAGSLGLEVQVRSFGLEEDALLEAAADLVLMGEVAGADNTLSFWSALKAPQLLFRRLLPPSLLAELDPLLAGLGGDEALNAALIRRAEERLSGSAWVNLSYHRLKALHLSAGLSGITTDIYGRLNLKELWVNRWPLEEEVAPP